MCPSSIAEPVPGQPRCGAGMRGLHLCRAGSGEGSGRARWAGTGWDGWDRTGQDGTGRDRTGRAVPGGGGAGQGDAPGPGGSGGGAERSGAAAAPDAPSLLLPLRLQRAAKSAGASSEEEPPQWLPPALAGRSYSGGGGEAGGRAGGIHTSRPGMPPPRLTPRLPRRRPAAASRFPEARPGGHRRGEPAPHACVPAGPGRAEPSRAGSPRASPEDAALPLPGDPPEDAPLCPRHPRRRMLLSPPRAAEGYLQPLPLCPPHHCSSPKKLPVPPRVLCSHVLPLGWPGGWLGTVCQAFNFTFC